MEPQFIERIVDILEPIFAVLFLGAFFWAVVKRKKSRALSLDDNEPIEGTDADRIRAENDLRDWNRDLRVTLLESHDLIERFHTTNGYSKEYMESLLERLRSKGIPCDTYFQETMPMGSATAVIDRQGIFELYVDRNQAEEAKKVVAEFRK